MRSREGAAGSREVVRSPPCPAATFFKLLLAVAVFLQRFAIPFGVGQLPLVVPVVLIVLVWSLQRGVLVQEPLRFQLYLVAVTWCTGMAAVASWRGLDWSPLSVAYLVLTYLPFAFRLRKPSPEAFRNGLSFFLKLMTVSALVGIVQVGAQFLGWAYHDLFFAFPRSIVLQGYQTSYPVIYGSSIFKANGVFFLEPSFYSQFLGLAIVVHLYLRRRGVTLYLYVVALVASVSGTGIVLVVAGTVALGASRRDKQFLRVIVMFVAGVMAVAVSPVGSVFTSRLKESASGTSSADGRFSAPYEVTASTLSGDALSVLTGEGPGAAERLSRQMETETGVVAVFPVAPKLALEYGLPAVVLFLWFVLTSTLRGTPTRVLSLSVLVLYLTLSGSLLQPATVYVLFAFTSLFSRDPSPGQAPLLSPVGPVDGARILDPSKPATS